MYSLREQALAKAGTAGIATFVMRRHEYLVAVKAGEGILTLHTLHRADGIRDPKKEIDSLPGGAKASEKELKMAEQLVETLSMQWDPAAFRDTFQEKAQGRRWPAAARAFRASRGHASTAPAGP
ncbi:Ku protein [Streptomyces sp. NPDC050448]|uniref:Ku protein n=1 Tax=Streptomyces sp. NPDC050448 TaxID=3155404 RepID=UPI003442D233